VRYIGSKERLLPFLEAALDDHGAAGGVFCDAFSGTTVVARLAKRRGYRVIANDTLYFSYVLQRAYLCCAGPPRFAGLSCARDAPTPEAALAATIHYLNALPPAPGFVYAHYSPGPDGEGRRYLSAANAARVDAIRAQIAAWTGAGLLADEEPYVLLAALIEAVPFVSNISGTYGAYLKGWDPRALKPLTLRPPAIAPGGPGHEAHQGDAAAVAARPCDVLYLDPPYNSRSYASNYHLLETIARYDAPAPQGKTGLRPDEPRSAYNAPASAAAALRALVRGARCRRLLLSYNSEGLIPEAEILAILGERGRPEVRRLPYRRFRSDADSRRRYAPQREVSENLYYVERPA
jgi:adenine-specific DNA-methyltransferase